MKSNSCFLVGNLGGDPVERTRTAKGDPIVGFTVAENVQSFDPEARRWKTLHTNWFSVTAFGTLADRVRGGLRKGDRVAILGRMKMSKFEDKTGAERTSFEIIAEDVAKWQTLPSSGSGGCAVSASGPIESIAEEPLPF